MGDRRGNPKRIENFANVVKAYTSHYGKNDDQTTVTEEERKTRQAAAAEIADSYYDFASAAYENGWSTHFHYTPFPPSFPPGESTIATALSFYEHRLAFLMDLKPHMKVLDVGCGIGGPAREIAKFVGCEIVGVSINQGQIDRAIYLTRMEGLQDKCTFVRGDFLNLPFASSSFDAAYSIEATVYSPSLLRVYSGISRVLKPGAVFGLSEWVMTPKYNPHDKEHVGIRNRIERGNALTMNTSDQAREAMRGAGFEILHEENFAAHFDYTKSLMEDSAAAGGVGKRKGRRVQRQEPPDLDPHQSPVLVPFKSFSCGSGSDDMVSLRPAPPPSSPFPSPLPVPPTTYRPWFWPFVSATHLATTWTDYWTVWKMSKWPRRCCYWMVWIGERVGLWDKGVTDAMITLAYCVDSTTEAGREEIFSPCWWFIGRKVGDGDGENIQRDA
ncbi:uncharacterized protein Z519_03176 [Cladophialophora bantiana CBS 173.52]|uniref:Sterol 24-C-methyltransferase n=1 Tax=Cladophialophora bantiana (strain ATCC 10958 / CBS 173.52 / CDC B-1940 / NIH 8579) TaxID=1442370 RepID=A0A0D2IHB2_CLAB1|nr:uncharacterized protein Z519_03176 [Cladophialophora bantiana CBS 173.52]KIW96109.1 hypothetical protein Z519_03176 [Cladophialophora bantiana CBS 173.52]